MIKTLILPLFFSALYSASAAAMNVTFINPGKEGERFWDMVTETMQAAATDFDIKLEVLYAQRNRVKMVELGDQVSARTTPPDYLVLVNEEQAAEKIFAHSQKRGIKTLMLLNDFLPDQRKRIDSSESGSSNLLGAVTPNNHAAGRRMMQALYHCAKARGGDQPYHMLAIGGDQLTPASIDRNQGAISVVQEQQGIKLDRFLYANWNQEEASNLTSSYLNWAMNNRIKPTAVWAANDPIALGVKDALLKHDLKPGRDLCLVGLNWSAQGLEMVKSGEMLLTDGGHFLAGAWSMVLLHDYHQRSKTQNDARPGHVNFQMQSIDQDNINTYLEHLGDENWDKIDFRGFSLKPSQTYENYDFSLQNVISLIKPH